MLLNIISDLSSSLCGVDSLNLMHGMAIIVHRLRVYFNFFYRGLIHELGDSFFMIGCASALRGESVEGEGNTVETLETIWSKQWTAVSEGWILLDRSSHFRRGAQSVL